MKICDRCFNKSGEATKAVQAMVFEDTDEKIDLCLSCASELKEFAFNPPKEVKRGRKRTRKAVAETTEKSA